MGQHYAGVEVILCDESFLAWYFKTDTGAIRQWERWMDENPAGMELVAQATELLSSLQFREKEFSPEAVIRAKDILLQRIGVTGDPFGSNDPVGFGDPAPAMTPVRTLSRKWWMAAASVILLAAGLYGAQHWLSRNSELRTAYGEVRNNRLPDGTDVMVNADSKIIYSTGWKDGKDREVWLTGEAFFHVSKTPMKSRFIVHTDHFDIIVTGTQFNVVNRGDKANVMLEEGSVILHTGAGKVVKMSPGDFVEYNNDRLQIRNAKADSILAWKEHKLLFDNTPLREVVRIIHEHYGVNIQLADEAIGDKTISGIQPNDNLDVLLRAIEVATDSEIIRESDRILIREHK